MSDDYIHSFIWDGEHGGNLDGIQDGHTWIRITSLSDIFMSVSSMYMTWSGRIEGSFFANFFMLLGKPIFNILNTLMFAVILMLICRISLGKYCWKNWKYLVGIFTGFWIINFAFFNTTLWVSGASNYLWPMFFQLVFILMYVDGVRGQSWKIMQGKGVISKIVPFLLGLLAGNTNENSALAVLTMAIILCLKKRTTWMWYGLLGISIGYAALIFAPGNYVRYHISKVMQQEYSFILLVIVKFLVLLESLAREFLLVFFFTPFLYANIRKKCYDSHFVEEYRLLWLFVLMGSISAVSMLASPIIPYRSMFGTTIFLLIASMISARIMSVGNIHYYRDFVIKIAGIFLISFTLCTMIVNLYTEKLIYDEFQDIVSKCNENIHQDIVIFKSEYPFMKKEIIYNEKIVINHDYTGTGMGHIKEDQNDFINQAVAEYYNLKSIRLNKSVEDK